MAGIKVNVWIFESYLRRTSNIPSLNTHLKRRSHHLSPWFLGNHFSKDIKILYQPTTSIIVLVSASTYLAGKMAIVPRNGRHNAVAHMNFTFRMFVVPLLSKEAGYAKFIPNNRGLPDIINDKPKLCVLVWFFLALAYIVGWRLKKSTIWEEPRTLSFEVLIMLAISQTKSVWILPSIIPMMIYACFFQSDTTRYLWHSFAAFKKRQIESATYICCQLPSSRL